MSLLKNYKKYFPMLKKIVYLDNSALVQKPYSVIKKSTEFYTKFCISNRTANSLLGNNIYSIIKEVRNKVAKLTNSNLNEVIYTSGTTDSLNKISLMLKDILDENDEILLSYMNHSSNIAPWVALLKEKNIKIKYSDDIFNDINSQTKIISISQINNSFKQDINIKKLYEICKTKGIILVNDAAQAIINEEVNLNYSDVIAFSSNKFYGPTGLGFLIVKESLLKRLSPKFYGGGSIASVKDNNLILQPGINGYEPGTLNLAAIYMFNESIDFFNNIIGGYKNSQSQIKILSKYLYKRLQEIENIRIYNKPDSSVFLFSIKNINSQDIAHFLGKNNIYLRSGNFCVPFIENNKNILDKNESFVRISLGIYNTKKDIDILVETLKKGGDFLEI